MRGICGAYTTEQTSFYFADQAVPFIGNNTADIRALGVGLPFAQTSAVFGGTAEYPGVWFKNEGQENYFYWYVSFCIFLSLVVYFFMAETTKSSLIGE